MSGYPRCPVSSAHIRTSLKFEEEEDMPRIVHIAIKVDDLEKATKFYQDVFGFRQTGTGYARGHVSRHLTDGNIDLALMVYDSEDVEEAQLSGPGPCIHHWGSKWRIATVTLPRSRRTAEPSSPNPVRAH